MNEKVKKRRPYLAWLAILFVLGLLVGGLPGLFSNDFILKTVLQRINEAGAVQVEVDDMQLRWQGVQEFKGLRVTLADGTQITANYLEVRKRLLPIVLDKDLGKIAVLSPVVILPEISEHSTDPVDPAPPPAETRASESATASNTAAESSQGQEAETLDSVAEKPGTYPELPAWKAVLQCEDGKVFAGDQLVIADWDARIDLNQGAAPMTLSMNAIPASHSGRLVMIGALGKPADGASTVDRLPVELSLSARRVDLAELQPLLARYSALDRLEGKATFEGEAEGSLAEGMDISADLALKQFKAGGPPLQGDIINLPNWKGELIARKTTEGWILNTAQFTRGPVRGHLHGSLEQGRLKNIETSLEVDLAEICSMLPNTLRLREGLSLQEGVAHLDLTINSAGEQQEGKGSLRLQDLAGSLNGTPLDFDYEVGAAFEAARGPEGLEVERCLVRAPFLTFFGRGNLQDLDMKVKADLGRLSEELGAFVDLQGWEAGGMLEVKAESGADSRAPNRLKLDAAFTQLGLQRNQRILMPGQDGTLTLEAAVEPSPDSSSTTLRTVEVIYQIVGATGVVNIPELKVPDTPQELQCAQASWSGTVKLQPLTELMSEIGYVPANSRFSGLVTFDSSFSFEENRFKSDRLQLSCKDLAWEQNDRQLHQDFALLTVDHLSFPLGEGPVAAGPLEARLDAGMVKMPQGFQTVLGTNFVEDLAAAMEIELDLSTLQNVLVQMRLLPPEYQLAGVLEGALTKSDDGGYEVDVTLSSASLQRGEELLLSDNSIKLAGVLRPGRQVWRLPQFSLESESLSLNATGVVKNPESDRILLMQGNLAYDLEQLQSRYPVLASQDVVFRGQTARPFRLKIPLGATNEVERWQGTDLAAELVADEIEAYGFLFSQVALPVQVQDGIGQAEISAKAGEGRVRLVPRSDGTQVPAQLTLDTSAPIWTNVMLTAELADRVLSRIHPMFKGSAVLEGSTTLIMDSFSMPLDESWQEETDFSGRLLLHDVRISSSSLMQELLQVVHLDAEDLDLGNRVIEFDCADGQINSSPIEFTVEGYELMLGGALGLDQRLRYSLSTPITKELVGKEIAAYAGQGPLVIPIRGTLTRPRIDSGAVKDILSQVGGSAIKEVIEKQLGDFIKEEDLEDRLKKLFR